MLRVSITPDPEVKARLSQLKGGKRGPQAQALQKAVSTTLTTARAELARAIFEHVNMRIGDIKQTIDVHRGSWDDASGWMSLKRKGVPLDKYATTAQKTKVLAQMKGGDWHSLRYSVMSRLVSPRKITSGPYRAGPQQIPINSFWVRFKSGHLGIYRREGKSRFPLRRVLGPSALGIAYKASADGMRAVKDDIAQRMNVNFQKNLRNAIRYQMEVLKNGVANG